MTNPRQLERSQGRKANKIPNGVHSYSTQFHLAEASQIVTLTSRCLCPHSVIQHPSEPRDIGAEGHIYDEHGVRYRTFESPYCAPAMCRTQDMNYTGTKVKNKIG